MKIIIIEDEEFAANDLAETVLKAEPATEIIAVLKSVKEAVAYFHKSDVTADLIFCDIQLGDGLSFEIFNNIQSGIPVIFCTAFDEYALQAFKTNGIDYILKPFSEKTISEALKKFNVLKRNFVKKEFNYDNIIELLKIKHKQTCGSILVYHKDKIFPVKFDNIAMFYIETGITYLVTFGNQTYAINKTLEELDNLTYSGFYRVNRQNLINRKAVKEVSQYFARKLSVTLTIPCHQKVIISKEKSTDFLNWLSR